MYHVQVEICEKLPALALSQLNVLLVLMGGEVCDVCMCYHLSHMCYVTPW